MTAKDNCLFAGAVVYRYRAGITWPDLPERSGERRARLARTTPARYRTPRSAPAATPKSSLLLPTPRQLSRHLLREPSELDAAAVAAVAHVAQDEEGARVVDLARWFCRIVRGSCGAQADPKAGVALDAWLGEARACGMRLVEGFTANLSQDAAAVRAGLRLPWSIG